MSSPPPPWESHPPLPDDGFYEADPDEDTGPLHVVAPTDEATVTYYPPPFDDDASHRPDQYRPPSPGRRGHVRRPVHGTADGLSTHGADQAQADSSGLPSSRA